MTGSERDDDMDLTLFHYDIQSHELLTREEEISLGRRIRAGCREVVAHRGHERVTRYEFSLDAKSAFDELVEHNQRLVARIALGYRSRRHGCSVADMISAGQEGLLAAAIKFDPARGYRFATYATYWIRQRIRRLLHSEGLIKVPEHLAGKYKPVTIMHFNDRLDRPRGHMALDDTERQDEYDYVVGILHSTFSRRAADIVIARIYGSTLQQIGERFHITKERVRQIETETMEKLRRIVHAREKRHICR